MPRGKKLKLNAFWLFDQYYNQRKSCQEIADIIGCSNEAIRAQLHKFDVPVRKGYDYPCKEETRKKMTFSKLGEKNPMHGYEYTIEQKQAMSLSRKGRKFSDEFKQNCSKSKIGVKNHMYGKKHSEETRIKISIANKSENNAMYGKRGKESTWYGRIHTTEERIKISKAQQLEKHWNWQGGISYRPYCYKFNDKLKEYIRDQFGHTCFICGKSEKNNNKKLSVHHVDYNKMQGCNNKWLLVPVCNSCNVKANYDRWYWFNLLVNYWVYNNTICFENYEVYNVR